jgi:hypothetical protein
MHTLKACHEGPGADVLIQPRGDAPVRFNKLYGLENSKRSVRDGSKRGRWAGALDVRLEGLRGIQLAELAPLN